MQQLGLLKKMLPGLLPILIFIIADEVWGTEIGLIVAIVIGVLQLVYFGLKEKRIEKFVLIDTLLIIAMGGISIILKNDIFFKLKPVIIEGILAAVLAFSLFSKHNIMLKMSERYMPDMEINEEQNKLMQKSIRNMLIILLLHIALTIYSAFYLSTEAWAFISTGLFYILIFGYFGIEFLIKFLKNKNTEFLPVVNEEGEIIGKASREECHRNPSLIYPIIRLHLFNKENQLLLQRRSIKSDIEPGKWDAAVAGHIKFDEKIEDAVKRETKEELNINITEFQLLHKRLFKAKTSTALMFVFIGLQNEFPSANLQEVEEVRFFTTQQIHKLIKESKASIGLEQEINELQQIKIQN